MRYNQAFFVGNQLPISSYKYLNSLVCPLFANNGAKAVFTVFASHLNLFCQHLYHICVNKFNRSKSNFILQ